MLAAGAVGWTTSVVLSSALLGARASRLSSIGSVAALCVGIALDIVLIPSYGAIGAAIATTSGFVAAGIASAIAFSIRFNTPTREFVPGRADLAELAGFGRNALTTVSKRRGIADMIWERGTGQERRSTFREGGHQQSGCPQTA